MSEDIKGEGILQQGTREKKVFEVKGLCHTAHVEMVR
jgi:hypothetical protein